MRFLQSSAYLTMRGSLMRFALVSAFISALSFSAAAQDPVFAWRKVLHTGQRVDITTDGADNVYTTGWVRSGRRLDIQLAKFSTGGTDLWFRFYSHPDGDAMPVAMVQDSDANTYILGNIYPGPPAFLGENYTVLLKFDSSGRLLWDRFYNVSDYSDEARAIAIDERTGEVVISGTSNSRTWDDFTYFTAKYDEMGNRLWLNSGPGSSRDVLVDSNGDTYVACTTPRAATPEAKDWTTIKYNAAGTELWRSNFNQGLYTGASPTAGEASSIALDEAGDVYIAGKDLSFMAIVKQSKIDGIVQWANHEPLTAIDPDTRFPRIAVHNSNNVYVAFPETSIATSNVLKYDYIGGKTWHRRYSYPGREYIRTNDVALDLAGNIYVGIASSSADGPLSSILKYGVEGDLKWVISPPTAPVRMTVRSLHVDPRYNVYYAGSRNDATVSEGLEMAVKYTQPAAATTVVPDAFEPFESFDFSAFQYERDWCWTDIIIDWKLNPICLLPDGCPAPNTSANLWSNGKLSWSKQFKEPFKTDLPDVKSPHIFSLALEIDQNVQDVVVLDDNLTTSGISSISLSAYPGKKMLTLQVQTLNGESTPFMMVLLNKKGEPIWTKEFIAPISTEISEQVKDIVKSIKFTAIGKDKKLNYYPNPVVDQITVKVGKDVKLPANVTVYSIYGKSVHRQTIHEYGDVVVSLKGQKPGLYVLGLKTQDSEMKEMIELK